MKTLVYSVFMFCVFSVNLFAQKRNRVKMLYKTETEFSTGSPAFDFDCKSKNRILLNSFLFNSYVTIKKGDSTYKFLKKNLYGYQTCNGQLYRFFDKKELLLLNSNEQILVYRRLGARPLSGRTNVTNYYFSVGKNGKILKLTFKNLKETFVGNKVFLGLIESGFKYNTDLAFFDEKVKKYKLNMLLEVSNDK
ncbi:MAG TPA: hypothetical protein PKA77_16945 [Chitinophagaceae bacterium]|nr:hypothetical protein [Chitinophagaceae bacterium]HMU58695.1 hypothetical protein [Chitinophagaceae bacterium]